MPLQAARLSFAEDGTPWSTAFDDVYHSAAGGLGQARHVFLGGNDLPRRWRDRDRFVILETGFGTGLNFLATWAAWCESPERCGRLHFISVEKHPFTRDDLRRVQSRWPEFATASKELCERWPPLVPGFHRLHFEQGRVVLTLLFGDAVDCLRQLKARVDAYFLDGFAPAKNPDLWSRPLFRQIARLANADATAATWSVSGEVKRGLIEAGFAIEKRPGYAAKREMLSAYRVRPVPPRAMPPEDRTAVVIGAGLAGAACAERLAQRGWQVTVLERHAAPAQEASGNLAGVLRPVIPLDDNRLSRLTRAGFLYARRHLDALQAEGLPVRFDACGVLQLARDAKHAETQCETLRRLGYPADYVSPVDQAEASRLAGHAVANGAIWFPSAGWVQPPSLVRANLSRWRPHITPRFLQLAATLEYRGARWCVMDAQGVVLAEAAMVILTNGADAARFSQSAHLPIERARGQVSHIPAVHAGTLKAVVTQHGYAMPPVDDWLATGATFDELDSDENLSTGDHHVNLARLDAMLPGLVRDADLQRLEGRVGFRPTSPDKRAIVGSVSRLPLSTQPAPTTLWKVERWPGLHVASGYGARGLVWNALCAELLASQLDADPLPLESDLIDALDPARFILHPPRKTAPPDASGVDD